VVFGQQTLYDMNMLKEPTIQQLEQLLKAFRDQDGTDAEINALAKDIIRDFRPEKQRPVAEVFGTKQHPSIQKITDFKKDPKPPIREAFSKFWDHWYTKYPIVFVGIFLIIFVGSTFPVYLAKLQPTKTVTKDVVSTKVLVQPAMAKSAPLDPGEVVPVTPTLVVPKLGVTAPILFINTYDEATVEDSLRNGVVHYYQTAMPGEVGNTFITGHSSNYWWKTGADNYIFANLDKLTVGDQAKIYYEGNKFLYQVTSIEVVEPTDLSVLDQTSKPTLTLMTCTPPGTSWKRLIVKFDQIAPVYKAPTIVEQPATKTNLPAALPSSDSNVLLDWIAKLFNF
jgi:LPXTG-site transpeptidase (sortase) family protein